ncbi:hypothetical protein G3I44_16015 [Halogeometricum borinquense]|uniref:Uncharacterized protein n=1 Tax=Halogeometricum borinquense TaxID=60847 RepID=A0A6C0UJP1_9EURY|nr:hypothetical protein [Halogeometricum borinquense]QIB75655.1 hypothetical protein G3I44_16015 [Halogeometricum borinquense]
MITGAVAQYKVAADGELTKAKNPNASSWILGSFINIPVQVVDRSKEDERRIEVDYFHRYAVVNFNGISWNGGIPSLSFGIGEESWVRESEPTENKMDNTYVDKL